MSKVRFHSSAIALGLLLAAWGLVPPAANAQAPQRQQQQARVHTPGTAGQRVLVTPEWVAQHASDANVRILDVRPDVHDYLTAPVPNAVYLADSTLRAPKQGLPVQYLPPAQLAQLLSRAGVTPKHHVIVYSDGDDVLGATMVAYTLERIGHTNVSVMDGGFTAFKQGQQTAQQYPRYTPSSLPARDNPKLRVELAEVKKLVKQPKEGTVFIDSRPPEAYRGEVAVWQRNGHIPGAINLPWKELTVADNPHQLKPVDDLRRIVSDSGISATQDIIVYCGTSREASLNFFALRHLLGFPKVRLYEGSWTEYSAQMDLPVAKGAEPRGVGGAGQEEPSEPSEPAEPEGP